MNIKATFINGVIKEEVYVEQLKGLEVHGMDSRVLMLKRALYELKKVPCGKYSKIDSYLLGMGFTKGDAYSNLYYILVGGELFIFLLYVDDLFLTSS